VPQSAIIAATKVGMDVTLAHPKGMELDPEVLAACEKQAKASGGSFKVSNNFEKAITGAHVVYPKPGAPRHLPAAGGPERPEKDAGDL